MDFFDKAGKMALGSRLRRLSEWVTEDAARIYGLYHIDMQPKWFPVFYLLSQEKEKSITEIADEIGHSHPSVSNIVREMTRKGYVQEKKDDKDKRRNVICLSPKGRSIALRLQEQIADVGNAIEQAMLETRHDLWKAIEEWEYLIGQKNLYERVKEQKKLRESEKIQIIDYSDEYHEAFRQLNEEWITRYFKMEESDYKALDHPREYILDKGGFIFIALYHAEAVGTCAMIHMADGGYELAKMAVSPKVQGKGIGYLLGKAVIDKAAEMGAPRVYLESNTKLTPAMKLYDKLGFRKIIGAASPYERCNIQMELHLDQNINSRP